MPKTKRMTGGAHLFLLFLVCVLGTAGGAEAATFMDVPDSGGLFRFHLLAPGEIGEEGDPSAFPLNEKELGSLRLGTEYWRRLLEQGAANASPLHIEVITDNAYDDNAAAFSETLTNGPRRGSTLLAGALTGDWFGDTGGERDKLLAFITIDHGANAAGEWYTGPMSSLPQNGDRSDLASTMLHELGHALGLSASVDEGTPPQQPTSFFFSSPSSLWTQGLRDSNGQAAQPGMTISPTPLSAHSSRTDCVPTAGYTSRAPMCRRCSTGRVWPLPPIRAAWALSGRSPAFRSMAGKETGTDILSPNSATLNCRTA